MIISFFCICGCLTKSRLKSQHEIEIREMERTERQTRDKYMESRSKLAQVEADTKNLHVTINQLEIQLTHSQKVQNSLPIDTLSKALIPFLLVY